MRAKREGVVIVRNRIAALTVVLSLMISMFLGTAPVSAASRDISLRTLVSDSATVQLFEVTNETDEAVQISWSTSLGEEGSALIPANGSTTIRCQDSGMTGLTLNVACNGKITSLRSVDTYRVEVLYQADGKTLQSTTINCSRSGGASHTAPETLTVGSDKYVLTSNSYRSIQYTSGVTQMVFEYEKQAKPSYTCQILYLDAYGNQLGSASMTVKPDQTTTFDVPDTITGSNGRTYQLASGEPSKITHDYDDGQKSYSIRYELVQEVSNNPYLIRIVYQDAVSGELLASQTATVQYGKTTTFNVASEYVTSDGIQYRRASGEPSQISHEYSDSQRTYVIDFEEQTGGNSAYSITVRYIDAMTGGVLKSNSVSVAVNTTARFSVASSFEAGGKTYLLASGQPSTITHQFGTSKRVYDVYFNERGADAVNEYNVTIRYFDITSNEVLYTTTATATLGSTLNVTAPEDYTAGGEEYVLLSGQDTSVAHDFYSTRHVYVFFYRNVEDTANEGTAVTPGTGGNTVVTTPDNNVITATPGGGITMTTPDGETVTILEPDVPMAEEPAGDESGETVTLEEEEIPLAEQPEEAGSGNALVIGLTVGGVVLLLAAAGVVGFIIWKKRRSAGQ